MSREGEDDGDLVSDSKPPAPPTVGLLNVDHSMVDWVAAARGAVLISIPVAIATTTNLVAVGVFAAIGSLNIVLLQFAGTQSDRLRRSAWGLGLNALAVGLGTIVGTLGLLEIPLVAIGLISIYLVYRIPGAGTLSLTVSALFVIGVGLPGGSIAEAGARVVLVLLGGAVALGGLALHIAAVRLRARASSMPGGRGTAELASKPPAGPPEGWTNAFAVGITAAGGLALALALGLERDYWIMLTVVIVLRRSIEQTLSIGGARVLGTVLGAALAIGVTQGVANDPLQGVLLVAFAFVMLSMIRANYTFFAVFMTAFVIILLNLVYRGGVLLAETRVLDTVLGGVLALTAATLLWFFVERPGGSPDRA